MVIIHFLIVQLGGQDLVDLALASIAKYAPTSTVNVVPLPLTITDPAAHGRAIDQWRETYQGPVLDSDVVVLMDPDVVILSEQWRVKLDHAFADDMHIGIWGAGAAEDFGPRVHASMMAIRGKVWNTIKRSFTPCRDPREREWRDTGGLYCLWATDAGWPVEPLERGPDWHGASAWWGMKWHTAPTIAGMYNWREPVPLWSHLGGSSHSDPTRMTWWQRVKRVRQIRRRREWITAVKEHLSCS